MKIFVTAKPGGKTPSITRIDATHFIIAVHEPAQDGRANVAITRAVAEYFNIAPSHVHLLRGATGKKKVFEIL